MHRLIIIAIFGLMMAAVHPVSAQELSGGDEAVPEDMSPETQQDAALRHYATCDLPGKFKSANPERNKALQAEFKAKTEAKALVYTGCIPYGETMERMKNKDRAKEAYMGACTAKVNPVALGCVRLGSLVILDGNTEEASKAFKKACDMGLDEGCKKHAQKNEESDLLFYTSLALIGLAVFILTNTMFQDEGQFKAAEQLEEASSGKDDIGKHGAVLKFSRPFFKRYVSPIVNSMKNKKAIKEKYRRKLASAGLTDVLSTEDFYSFKLFLIIGFPIVFMAVRAFLETDWPLALIPVMAGVGFVYPDLWVSGKIQQRQREIIMNMPFAVDLLALSVEAGLDFIAAMSKVMDKARKSALTEEFGIVIKEIKIGASRAEALRNMAWRADMIQISSFCATLIAADSVGASIGPILKNLAIEIRQKKTSEAEKAGATAATKILFPMLFLITPAVFLVIAAPMLLEALGFKK